LRKIVSVLLVGAAIPFAAVASPAQAGDGGAIAAGVLGGLAAGTIVGIAATTPRYGPPPPMYVGCYWTHGTPYWDGYGCARPGVRVSVPKLILRPLHQLRQLGDKAILRAQAGVGSAVGI
jgi:hypothetical protein